MSEDTSDTKFATNIHSCIQLHFKREEYVKYQEFVKLDKNLDLETTVTLDRGIALLAKWFVFEERKEIYWLDKEGNRVTTPLEKGWAPNIRALCSHLALDVWYPTVKDLMDTKFNVKNEKYLNAIRWTAVRRSGSGSRVHIVMPLYTGGILDYPTKYASLFSRSFILNFSLAKFFLGRFDYAFLKEIVQNGQMVVNEQVTLFKALMGTL